MEQMTPGDLWVAYLPSHIYTYTALFCNIIPAELQSVRQSVSPFIGSVGQVQRLFNSIDDNVFSQSIISTPLEVGQKVDSTAKVLRTFPQMNMAEKAFLCWVVGT
jgi:hypothetical protein